MNLNKFLEFDGHIYEALESYKKLCLSLEQKGDLEFYYFLLSQKVRLLCIYSKKETFHPLYLKLLEYSKKENKRIFVELQHALLLSELRLKGEDVALERLKLLRESKNIDPLSQDLLVFEVIEHKLLKNGFLKEKGLLNFIEKRELLEYDKLLLDFATDDNFSLDLKDLLKLKMKMTTQEVLKLSSLSFLRTPEKGNIETFIYSLLDSTSSYSKNLWLDLLKNP